MCYSIRCLCLETELELHTMNRRCFLSGWGGTSISTNVFIYMYTGLQIACSQHSGFWIVSSAAGVEKRALVSSSQPQLLRQNSWRFKLPIMGKLLRPKWAQMSTNRTKLNLFPRLPQALCSFRVLPLPWPFSFWKIGRKRWLPAGHPRGVLVLWDKLQQTEF